MIRSLVQGLDLDDLIWQAIGAWREARTIHPGHGAPGDPDQLIEQQRSYLLDVRRLVRPAIDPESPEGGSVSVDERAFGGRARTSNMQLQRLSVFLTSPAHSPLTCLLGSSPAPSAVACGQIWRLLLLVMLLPARRSTAAQKLTASRGLSVGPCSSEGSVFVRSVRIAAESPGERCVLPSPITHFSCDISIRPCHSFPGPDRQEPPR